MVVLPWVPVTPITVRSAAGSPWTWAASRPSTARGRVDDEHGGAGGETGRAVLVGQHGDRAGGEGLLGEVGAVRAGAREGGVQVAGDDPLGAQGHAGDLDREVAVTADVDGDGGQGAEPVGQVGQSGDDGRGGPGADLGVADHVRRVARTGHHSTGRREGLPSVGGTP